VFLTQFTSPYISPTDALVYCRTVQHIDTNKDLIYAATPPPY